MFLHRPSRGGLIAKEKLEARFHAFGRGDWGQLLEASQKCDEKAAQSRRRGQRRTVVNDVEKSRSESRIVGAGRRIVSCQTGFSKAQHSPLAIRPLWTF